MCIAIPAQICEIEGEMAQVIVGTIEQSCSLALVPEAIVGDYVIIHAGYALTILDHEEALKTLELFRQLAACGDD